MAGLEIAIAGATVGFAVGLTGMGGGALMAPLLVLLFHVDPLAAVSSDLLSSLAMKPVGAWVHLRRGTVHRGIALMLCAGSVPAAFASAWCLHRLGPPALLGSWVEKAIGAALLLACTAMLARAFSGGRPGTSPLEPPRVRPVPTLLLGALGGIVVGTTSVGAGSLMLVLLMGLYPALSGPTLVGTDLVQAIPLVGAAALGHALFGGVHLALTGWLVAGAVPAAYLGARISSRASTTLVRPVLLAVLLASGLKLLQVPLPWLLTGTASGLGVLGLLGWRSRFLTEEERAERALTVPDPLPDADVAGRLG